LKTYAIFELLPSNKNTYVYNTFPLADKLMNIFIYSMELITVPLDVYRSTLKDIDEQTQA
jgi:hypothetical protein